MHDTITRLHNRTDCAQVSGFEHHRAAVRTGIERHAVWDPAGAIGNGRCYIFQIAYRRRQGLSEAERFVVGIGVSSEDF